MSRRRQEVRSIPVCPLSLVSGVSPSSPQVCGAAAKSVRSSQVSAAGWVDEQAEIIIIIIIIITVQTAVGELRLTTSGKLF